MMRSESDREFQLDAIEVALHQINRRLERAEQERKLRKNDNSVSFVEEVVDEVREHLEKKGKNGLSAALGIGFSVFCGLFEGMTEAGTSSPLVSGEARKWI